MKPRKPESADSPRVSVITIFLNREAFLPEAIESVIAQSFVDWELLLVDDGSGPAATAIAKNYAAQYPGQIRYLEHPGHTNRGMSATRNLGIRQARGEFIAFIDADDVWLPSKLADHVALFDAHAEVGMVCGTAIYWQSWSNGTDAILPTGHRQDVVIHPPNATLAWYPLGTAHSPCPSDIVLRADLVKRLGGSRSTSPEIINYMRIKAFLRRSICQHRSGPAVRRCSSIASTPIFASPQLQRRENMTKSGCIFWNGLKHISKGRGKLTGESRRPCVAH